VLAGRRDDGWCNMLALLDAPSATERAAVIGRMDDRGPPRRAGKRRRLKGSSTAPQPWWPSLAVTVLAGHGGQKA
jgi:hypothetical protein